MKVLQLSTMRIWRGGENQIRLLLEGLKSRAVENYIAFPKGSPALSKLEHLGQCLALPSSSFLDPRSLRDLLKLCRNESIPVINAHSSGAHTLGLWIKRRLPGVKLVVHRRVAFQPQDRLWTRRKYLSKNVDRYVAISDCIRRVLVDYGISESRITVVPSAVDPSPYADIQRAHAAQTWRQKMQIPAGRVLLGSASALTREKGLDVLLKALARLRTSSVDFHCLMAGEGNDSSDLRALCRELQLSDRVRFVGHVENIQEFLSALDVLVMPSLEEGLGSLLLEGSWAGACLVASDTGGIPEVVISGKTGLLAPPGDDKELAARLATVIENAELRQQLSREGVNHIKNNFSLESMVEGNLSVYRELAASRV